MNLITLDIGTTAAKAAAFDGTGRNGEVLKADMPLQLQGDTAQLDAKQVIELAFGLIRQAAQRLGGRVDRIALATMCPAICLLDRSDAPITPILCHLDRRSEPQATRILEYFGERALLATTGNLPVPGGIASTMLAWLAENRPEEHGRLAKVAPLTTLITSRLTGRHACDPGTAAFLGTYDIRQTADAPRLEPWPDMLEFLHLSPDALPEVRDGGESLGRVRGEVARDLGLATEPEVSVGLMDTSAACLHAGLAVGNMYNVVGTTDVLVICSDRPQPRRGVLTRPVGTGPLWLAINTMAAVGAALDWVHRTFFADCPDDRFFEKVEQVWRRQQDDGNAASSGAGDLRFDPSLAGSRMQVHQRYGLIRGLRLSTTREQVLAALLDSLAAGSRKRLRILARQVKPNGQVFVAGGASEAGTRRHWPQRYDLSALPTDASLQGLRHLAEQTGEWKHAVRT